METEEQRFNEAKPYILRPYIKCAYINVNALRGNGKYFLLVNQYKRPFQSTWILVWQLGKVLDFMIRTPFGQTLFKATQ